MRAIIAGGRNYKFTDADVEFLNKMAKELPITEVVSGLATGADEEGKYWAEAKSIPVTGFRAAWERWGVPDAVIGIRQNGMKYNKLAGFWRNQQMADYAEVLIAFPGGNGTADMVARAEKKGLKIIRPS